MDNARTNDCVGWVDNCKRYFEALLRHILVQKIAVAAFVAVAIFVPGVEVNAQQIYFGIDTNTYSTVYSLESKGFETGTNQGEVYFDRSGAIAKGVKPQRSNKVNNMTLEEYQSRGGKLPVGADIADKDETDRGFFGSLVDKLLGPIKAIQETVGYIGEFFKNFFKFDIDRITSAFKGIKIFNLMIRGFAPLRAVRLWGIDVVGMAEKAILQYMWILRAVLGIYIFRKFFNVFDGGDE